MNYINNSSDLRSVCNLLHEKDKKIGFVPTMGYLHRGHTTLIEEAKKSNDVVIVSIFVNPTQFGPNEDLDKYPRDIQSDLHMCEEFGVDIVFCPNVDQMYPQDDLVAGVYYPELTAKLCGKYRPGHFNGVLNIMNRFFILIEPDRCYMGKKDGQQFLLVQKMAEDHFQKIQVIPCPTIREYDGLALSSRNVYLSAQERKDAVQINIELETIAQQLTSDTETEPLLKRAITNLKLKNLEPQYFEFVDQDKLNHVDKTQPGHYLLCTAVMCGSTRLIDNYFLDISSDGILSFDKGKRPNG